MKTNGNAGKAIRVFAPAKINWALTVTRRREDGFHDLNTIFQALAWGDELACTPLSRRICHIESDDPTLPLGGDNLIARAWRQLAAAYPDQVGGLSVRVTKRIPQGAGLGGGSSDAAATLMAVNRIFGLRLRRKQLEEHAATLGSDCAFFIRGGTALATGRGEQLTRLNNRLGTIWLVVVYPGFASPTREAYAKIQPRHWQDARAAFLVARAIENGKLHLLKNNLVNVFNELVTRDNMRYKDILTRIKGLHLTYPLLSGSGSSVFAFARDRDEAMKASDALRREYPVCVATRLRRSGVTFF